MQHMKWKWALKALAFGLIFITVFPFVTMLLWNNLAATIFGLPTLTFFQTIGLMVLGRLLTGGFGGGRGAGGWRRGQHWRERWQNMTPEQREQAKQRWGKRGWGPMSHQDETPDNQNTVA